MRERIGSFRIRDRPGEGGTHGVKAETKRREAVAAYLEHGGDKILGVSPAG